MFGSPFSDMLLSEGADLAIFIPARAGEPHELSYARFRPNQKSTMTEPTNANPDPLHEPKRWHDDGWAVEMTKDGEPEPALVGPWTMGRDKRNPKPLDANAFRTLVKTAYEVRRRHEQHLHATLHKEVTVDRASARGAVVDGAIVVTLDIVPDDHEPYAVLRARAALEPDRPPLGETQVSTTFKLTDASARAWIDGGYRRPS